MDPRVRFFDETELLETLADDIQSRIRTAIPVALSEDSEDGHSVKVQAQTKLVRRAADGTLSTFSMPQVSDVVVKHAGGGTLTKTVPLKKGDEGIFIVADRALDAWYQQSGEQAAVDARMHSLSDGWYVPGGRSLPRKLKGVSKDSMQSRTDDKKTVHDVSESAVTAVREQSAHQVNGMAVQSEKGSSRHIVDTQGIQSQGGKFFWNS
jgi:hypothetical protein